MTYEEQFEQFKAEWIKQSQDEQCKHAFNAQQQLAEAEQKLLNMGMRAESAERMIEFQKQDSEQREFEVFKAGWLAKPSLWKREDEINQAFQEYKATIKQGEPKC